MVQQGYAAQVDEGTGEPLVDLNTGQVLVGSLRVADTFGSRFVGLMGRKDPPDGEALLLKYCASVHTCFMRFPIDVAFLDRDMWVVAIYPEVKPWRMVTAVEHGLHTLEIAAGALEAHGVKVGHRLQVGIPSGPGCQ